MKIFGFNFTTKKELKNTIVSLENLITDLEMDIKDCEMMINDMLEDFPFFIGQTVYDIALKNNKGRYARTNPSFEHSTITAVVVDEKNYFSLVSRYRRNDVFSNRVEAEEFLKSICK